MKFNFTGAWSERTQMGYPKEWEKISSWLFDNHSIPKYTVQKHSNKILCPELPVLQNYYSDLPESYWNHFPKKDLPEKPECDINTEKLKQEVTEHESKLTLSERSRAEICIENLKLGASSYQKIQLPACFTENANNIDKFGKEVADTVASWVKKGFVAGPFEAPPLRGFRVNKLIAIQQNEKVRPVLDLSEPKGASFNDNVAKEKLEKVVMSSSKRFGKSLYESGKGSRFSKCDFVDAYKNVPVKMEDLRLQGFTWKGKFFVETRQVFGAKNFDILANTLVSLANCRAGIPKKFIHRTLDDVPVISPACNNWSEKFDEAFEDVCEKVNVKLAPECEKKEKAFKCCTAGKVLGTFFNSEDLTWKSPDSKRLKYLEAVREVLQNRVVDLLRMQFLMGCLNHAGQLAPFMAAFRFNLNKVLGFLQTNPGMQVAIPEAAQKELRVWANFLLEEGWHQLPGPYFSPPVSRVELISDAAGLQEGSNLKGDIGCGSIGFDGSFLLTSFGGLRK
jgi:hypothetical protein